VPLHTGHATLYDFSSSQHPLSFDRIGGAENAGLENAGVAKIQGWKTRDWKMQESEKYGKRRFQKCVSDCTD